MYFKGELNTRGILSYASANLNFSDATEVVVSGGSAGGLAGFYWIDDIGSLFNSSYTKVYGILDSGIFLDVVNQQTKILSYRISL